MRAGGRRVLQARPRSSLPKNSLFFESIGSSCHFDFFKVLWKYFFCFNSNKYVYSTTHHSVSLRFTSCLYLTASRRLSSLTAAKGQMALKLQWLVVLVQLVVWRRSQWDLDKVMDVTASGGGRGGSNGGRSSSHGGLGGFAGRGSIVLPVGNWVFTWTMYVLRGLKKA